jgi:hypothetical protein
MSVGLLECKANAPQFGSIPTEVCHVTDMKNCGLYYVPPNDLIDVGNDNSQQQ